MAGQSSQFGTGSPSSGTTDSDGSFWHFKSCRSQAFWEIEQGIDLPLVPEFAVAQGKVQNSLPAVKRYMHEIDGARGIALLLVVLFHVFGNGRVSGGVDVFLVLSAYFLSRKLLAYFYDKTDFETSISKHSSWLGSHYLRVATRLIPSAAIVLLGVLAINAFWVPVTIQLQNYREILASALYYENWELINSQLSYGAAGPSASPLQHFWSLAVQGQFFLVWPIIAFLIFFGTQRLRSKSRTFAEVKNYSKRIIFYFLCATTTASFVWALFLTKADQPVAYLNSISRFWELGLGALIAFLPSSFAAYRWIREGSIWLGLTMIITCGFILDGATLFPGLPTLWPVTGALLVVFGSSRDVGPGLAARILGGKPVKLLSRFAYQLYLCHWPILVFYMQIRDRSSVGIRGAAIVLVLSMVAAVVIESLTSAVSKRSLRTWSWKPAVLVPLAPLLLVVTVTLAQMSALQHSQAAQLTELSKPSPDHIGAAMLLDPEGNSSFEPVEPFRPSVENAFADLGSIYDVGCIQSVRETPGTEAVKVCDVDNYGDNKTVVLGGGSYAVQWYPALRQIAKQQGWRLLVIEKDGCRLTSDPNRGNCTLWNNAAIETIASYDPDAVFTLGSIIEYDEGTKEEVPQELLDQVQKLGARGIDVVGIRGTPKFSYDVPSCVAENLEDPSRCGQLRSNKYDEKRFSEITDNLPSNFHIIDLVDGICNDETCDPIVGNMFVYRDRGHLTGSYALTLTPAMFKHLKELDLSLF